jgi:hypothetical protein
MRADKKPLKVLIASRSFDFRGGVANYVRALVEHADSSLVSFTHVAVSKSEVTSSGWRRPFEYLDSLVRFGRSIREVRPDVVHLNPSLNHRSLPLHICLLLVAKALGQSVYLFIHGHDERHLDGAPSRGAAASSRLLLCSLWTVQESAHPSWLEAFPCAGIAAHDRSQCVPKAAGGCRYWPGGEWNFSSALSLQAGSRQGGMGADGGGGVVAADVP